METHLPFLLAGGHLLYLSCAGMTLAKGNLGLAAFMLAIALLCLVMFACVCLAHVLKGDDR